MKKPTKKASRKAVSPRKPAKAARTAPKSASKAASKPAARPCAVVVLAAGQGTRMKSSLPKVLHVVAGRPMLGHVLATAQALAAARTVVVVAPGMDVVAEAAKPAVAAIQQKQLGTGDAVKAARRALNGFKGDVLVLFGDTPLLRPETLRAVLGALDETTAIAVLGFRPEGANEYGRLVAKPNGRLERIVEYRDASAKERRIPLCNSGVMAVRGEHLFGLLDGLKADNAKGEYYLTDIVALARKQKLRARVVEGAAEELLGVNSRADLAVAEAVLQQRLRAAALADGVTMVDPSTVYFSADTKIARDVVVGPNVMFGPGVAIGEGTTIRAFCHIEGATVGASCIIGPFARLRPGAELADEVHVGNFCEIKAAKLERGAKVNHLSYIGDARVGRDTNIGAGTITCNYDGYDKHLTDIGANVFVGSDVAFVAPVVIGDGAVIGAGSVVTRDVPADALAVTRAEERQIAGAAGRFRDRKRAAKVAKTSAAKKSKA
ncbi:MAG TPA: bifunctional UDP-N-acetylglucosamine diphosphorylase/glucosamine-1-phosphate N-acetyltransferase GlmU [Alphaproteobacteria bacterium]|jgi:bifunctional UDP-N-acetylglucosamine pyrophosphorylase/glucosamine-1-phosphate N-acetyltransferase